MRLIPKPQDLEEMWTADVWSWAAAFEDCLWLKNVDTYRDCRVAGVVRQLRVDPGRHSVEARISDGTASLTARWDIQDPCRQLGAAPGTGLILQGPAGIGPDGEFLMLEPDFDIVPGPHMG
ncbi:MAG: hypothetical protein ACREIT_10700 [Tepidisphaeraceae bacterium]